MSRPLVLIAAALVVSAVPALGRLLAGDSLSQVGMLSAGALGRIGTPEALDALRAATCADAGELSVDPARLAPRLGVQRTVS